MANTIKVKRATEANVGTLEEGEVAFLTDVKRLVVGAVDGNQLVDFVTEADLDARLDGMTIDVLSTAEYGALDQTAKDDPTKLYILNDATDTVIDLSGYVTKNGTDRLMTEAEANKLAGIAEGAEVNVQADWNEIDDTNDAFIKNKPTNLVTTDNVDTTLVNFMKTADADGKFATKDNLNNKVNAESGKSLVDDAIIAKFGKLDDIDSKAVDIGIDAGTIKLKNAAGEFMGTGISIADLKTALGI